MMLRIESGKETRERSIVVSLDMTTASQVYTGTTLDNLSPSRSRTVTILAMKTL